MRPIPTEAVDLTARFEGLRLTAYQDIVGVLTIGYGSTGPHVTPGLKITKDRARELLKADLEVAATRLSGVVKQGVIDGLTDGQYAALLSFVFNLGANKSWTIWKVLNAGQLDAVPAQIRRFVNAGGKRVQGLVNRREAEAALFAADLHAADEVLPSSVTRSVPTPPTPEPVKPLVESKTFMTAGATAVASAAAGVAQVTQTIQPFAAQSDKVANMVATLAMIGAVLAVLTLVFAWLKHRGAQR
jgi:lysozyme